MKRSFKVLAGLAVGLLLLWLLFRGTSFSEFWASVRRARIGWFLAAWVPLALTFFVRIERWRYIVHAVNPEASYRSMFSSTQIGFLANFAFPARIGEFVRALVLARMAGMPVTRALAMVTLDRVTDLVGLLATVGVALVAFRPSDVAIPGELWGGEEDFVVRASVLEAGGGMLTLALIGLVAALVLLYVKRDLALRVSDACLGLVSKKLAARIHEMLEHFADGLHVFRSISDMAKSNGFSLVTWALFLVTTECLVKAFGIALPWYGVFVVQAMVALGIAVPVVPGGIGQFQAGVVAGLIMVAPDVAFADALAVGMALYLINLIQIAAFGVFCLQLEGLSLAALGRETSQVREEIAHEAD